MIEPTPTKLFDVKTFPTQTFLMQFNQPLTVDVIFTVSQDAGVACLLRFGTAATDFLARFNADFL